MDDKKKFVNSTNDDVEPIEPSWTFPIDENRQLIDDTDDLVEFIERVIGDVEEVKQIQNITLDKKQNLIDYLKTFNDIYIDKLNICKKHSKTHFDVINGIEKLLNVIQDTIVFVENLKEIKEPNVQQ